MSPTEQMAEDLWEKYADFGVKMERQEFTSALHEYGAAVRQRAAGVAREHQPRPLTVGGIIERESCAAAIERMELP